MPAPRSTTIPGPVGPIEAEIQDLAAPRAIAVLCHPHPLQQGTMHNKVVTTLARAFHRLGTVALRFNFRGVGRSGGVHADGIGERDDALAVIDWSRAQWPGLGVYLGGFSFGAVVALAIAARLELRGLVTVAPPVARLAGDFTPPTCRWLLLQGEDDEIVPADSVIAWAKLWAPAPTIRVFAGVGHFFHGRLGLLTESVNDVFGPELKAA